MKTRKKSKNATSPKKTNRIRSTKRKINKNTVKLPVVFDDDKIIVEHSYNPKQKCFVVRMLSGNSYVLKLNDLPKKLLTNSPEWDSSMVTPGKDSILVKTHKDIKIINISIIKEKGKNLN